MGAVADWASPEVVIQIVTTAAVILIAGDKWIHRQESADVSIKRDLDRLKERMDQAGELMSDLATEVQGLAARFVTLREHDLSEQDTRRELTRLQHEIEAIWADRRKR